VQTAVLLLGVTILTIIAYCDVRERRIPNVLSLAVGALGLTRLVLAGDPIAAGYTLIAATAVLVVAFLLFWHGVIGGGDAKLIPAMVLFIGYSDLLDFLFLMSMCGGLLALIIIARDKVNPRGLQASVAGIDASTRSTVPYGVAIAAAGVVTLVLENTLTR
jgi:prepilin peptidase CpaA